MTTKATLLDGIDRAGFPRLPAPLKASLGALNEEALEALRSFVETTYDRAYERGHWAGRVGGSSTSDREPDPSR